MTLEKNDLELIEKIVYKNADDIAVSIARSFERLEERIDSSESRLYGKIAELENMIKALNDLEEDLGDDELNFG